MKYVIITIALSFISAAGAVGYKDYTSNHFDADKFEQQIKTIGQDLQHQQQLLLKPIDLNDNAYTKWSKFKR